MPKLVGGLLFYREVYASIMRREKHDMPGRKNAIM